MANTDKRKQSLYFPEEMLKEIQDEANRQDRSLSWIVQQAWRIARTEIMRFPSVNDVLESSAGDTIGRSSVSWASTRVTMAVRGMTSPLSKRDAYPAALRLALLPIYRRRSTDALDWIAAVPARSRANQIRGRIPSAITLDPPGPGSLTGASPREGTARRARCRPPIA